MIPNSVLIQKIFFVKIDQKGATDCFSLTAGSCRWLLNIKFEEKKSFVLPFILPLLK